MKITYNMLPPCLNNIYRNIKELLFIPFAGVSVSWDDYTTKVQNALPDYKVKGIHQFPDAHQALENAQAILVGGGNTFNLLNQLYQQDLIDTLKNLKYMCMALWHPYLFFCHFSSSTN